MDFVLFGTWEEYLMELWLNELFEISHNSNFADFKEKWWFGDISWLLVVDCTEEISAIPWWILFSLLLGKIYIEAAHYICNISEIRILANFRKIVICWLRYVEKDYVYSLMLWSLFKEDEFVKKTVWERLYDKTVVRKTLGERCCEKKGCDKVVARKTLLKNV